MYLKVDEVCQRSPRYTWPSAYIYINMLAKMYILVLENFIHKNKDICTYVAMKMAESWIYII